MSAVAAIVCRGGAGGPSEKQALGFAAALAGRGEEVLVALHGDPAGAGAEGLDVPAGVTLIGYRFRGRSVDAAARKAVAAARPGVVHAFSPRASVIRAATAFSDAAGGAPLLVHYEDDERSAAVGGGERRAGRRAVRAAQRLAGAVHPPAWPFETARSRRTVRRRAVATDALTPALAREVARTLGRECAVILPVTPAGPVPSAVAPDAPPVVTYTGNVFAPHRDDFLIAIRAVALLRARGFDVRLRHAGTVARRFDLVALAAAEGLGPEGAEFLGPLPYHRMPELLARATVLVQPGHPTPFNALRLPSKLQTYLVSGVPTVTFACGFGELLEDRTEVLKTRTGDPGELADRIQELLEDPGLRERIAAGGRRAAARLFDAEANAGALLAYYRDNARCRR